LSGKKLMDRRQLLTGTAAALLLPRGVRAEALRPAGAEGDFSLLRNWTFGRGRADGTVSDMAGLSRDFRFRYIYDHGRQDGLPTYWSRHRDYPEGDPRSLHVFTTDALILKGRIPPGGGLHAGGIESGLLRALLPVTSGMYVEMRAKLTRGLGVWPAFWLNPGIETPPGQFSATPWPPEIDIFEFFVWQGRSAPRVLEAHVQTDGHPERYGDPHDTYTASKSEGYDPGIDFSADYHVFAMDWVDGLPTWVVDGRRIKQTAYLWNAPPAHILVTNAIGMTLPGVDLSGMQANEANWDYCIDYLRVWQRHG
jgi:hypothetical protein